MYIAHPGHWLVNIAYFVPVVVFLAWLVVTQVKERRRDRSDGHSQST
jgi:membrane protein implicated in regulation of membrane protease activity